ncbi:MAG: TAT-variant-translocated molybdopterin oxidoreductase [Phycisphaerae bacterium]|nr:TAT-variant-translocated molybdopterin oxidoreductase [Phycisphaerae bacterium]
MSDRRKMLDQCPTSHDTPAHTSAAAPSAKELHASSGKVYWRSLDQLAGSGEFKEFLQREFPAYASELLDGSRRHFLRIMGASLALAGAATVPGCRRPENHILAYNKQPEEIVPGKPLFYATAMPLPGGGCEGLLAETFEGRPTKLEGNPLHPENLGRSTIVSQSSVLDLYDPDRDPAVYSALASERGQTLTATKWDDFVAFAHKHFGSFDLSKGEGLSFLVEKSTSPSRDAIRDRMLKKWPNAKWHAYEAIDDENSLEGTRAAFGSAFRESLDLSKARVIVSFDRDFLGGEGCTLGEARGYAAGRYIGGTAAGRAAADAEMSRLYVIESMMSLTGGQADHRFAVKPSRVGAVAAAVAQSVLARLGGAAPAGLASAISSVAGATAGADLPSKEAIDAMADDLVAHRGAGAVLAGPTQPAAVHALVAALNSVLGHVGKTVRYLPVKGDAATSSAASIKSLVSDMDAGRVSTLVVIGCNPVYDAPADLNFAEKYAKIAHRIHLGAGDETAMASTMHLTRCHYLETWSDVTSWDGTFSVVQPMIQPLFVSKGELEFLATIAGENDTDPYTIVRDTLRARVGLVGFESVWRRTLHDGLMPAAEPAFASPALSTSGVASAVATLSESAKASEGVELLFLASPHVHDGRFANNGWLQELPHAVTKVSWDNPALASPATMKKLGFSTDRHPKTEQYNHAVFATISAGGKSADLPLWPQPGMAEGTVAVHLGYGRRISGRIGAGTGFDTYVLRSTGSMRIARGVTVTPNTGKAPHLIATTQDHWTMEGRDILREIDLPAWKKFGDEDFSQNQEVQKDPYDRTRNLNFAGRLGMESHAPANVDIYKNKQKQAQALRFTEQDEHGNPLLDAKGQVVAIKNQYGKAIQQWGMSIDLTTCSGCGACTIACQAENNIPIVGKKELAKGREMHWMRVDRYYGTAATSEAEKNTLGVGGDADIIAQPDMLVMPVTCVHCENAPCEVVCPVNATVHDEQGNNNMAYNRCIGTRYCSNNCPYKVRRFNFFDYGTKQFRGNFAGKETVKNLPEIMQPPSEYFVPPRLRQKKLEVATMQNNPHVTVRSRGMMEKCTYCIQRVNMARVETKLADLSHIPDGFMQTACEQACPTGSIVFGDIYDHDANEGRGSRVKQKRNDGRSYQLLSFLNTRPRTTHMVRLRNPNPALADAARKARWEQPFHHAGHGGHADPGSHTQTKSEGHVMSLPILSVGNGVLA